MAKEQQPHRVLNGIFSKVIDQSVKDKGVSPGLAKKQLVESFPQAKPKHKPKSKKPQQQVR
jgi:hypothetical protein